MDRGIPTEETLETMRTSNPSASYLVGTPKGKLTALEADLAPRDCAAIQRMDVHLPITDGREIIMACHTQPEKDLQLLLDQLKLELPEPGPPEIQSLNDSPQREISRFVAQTFGRNIAFPAFFAS